MAIAFAVVAVVFHPLQAAGPSQAERPNIIFILSDDLSYGDLGCLGQKHYATPNIDRLAKEGMVFTKAYAGAAWCAPSRTALLTGRNSYNNKPLAYDAKGVPTRFHPTVAEMLKAEGYATCIIGKWHMAEPRNDWGAAPFDNDHQLPWNRGFDVCRVTMRRGLHHENWWWPSRVEYALGKFLRVGENENKKRGLYGAAYNQREAVKFMEENRDRPFFLYYSTPIPHGPLYPPPGENRFEDRPWTEAHQQWAAIIEAFDGSVGALMKAVRDLGLENRTYIFLTSDNGYSQWLYVDGLLGVEYPRNHWGVYRPHWTDDPVFHNKGPSYGGKFMSTIGGVHVPLIAWGPGVMAGASTSRAVNLYDFMATASELSGAKLPGPTDGVGFASLLKGGEQPLRKEMVWAASSNKEANGVAGVSANIGSSAPLDAGELHIPASVLLDERWFVMQLGENYALFDAQEDPGMERNLAASHPELVSRAEEVLRQADPATPNNPPIKPL